MQPKLISILTIVIALILVAGIGWFGLQQRNTDVGQQTVSGSPAVFGEQLPDISLTDYEGKIVRLADFAGKPLVVNAWAVWCPFCVKELADFAAAQKEFGPVKSPGGDHGTSDQVVFIAINRAEPRDVAKEFTDGLGISNELVFLLDPSDSFYQAIGGFSMPETLFVKADGTTHFHKRGPLTLEEIRQRTQELVVSR